MESILRAAARALGGDLSDPVDLGGSTRSTVLRCATADGGSVVVKAYTAGPTARRAFAARPPVCRSGSPAPGCSAWPRSSPCW